MHERIGSMSNEVDGDLTGIAVTLQLNNAIQSDKKWEHTLPSAFTWVTIIIINHHQFHTHTHTKGDRNKYSSTPFFLFLFFDQLLLNTFYNKTYRILLPKKTPKDLKKKGENSEIWRIFIPELARWVCMQIDATIMSQLQALYVNRKRM